MSNVGRLIQAERQLQEVATALKQESIRFLLMKGPVMAWTAYQEPAVRVFGDLDLLVNPEHFIQARDTLIQLGYQCQFRSFETFRDSECNEIFPLGQEKQGFLGIELHWSVHVFYGNRKRIQTKTLFRNARRIKIG